MMEKTATEPPRTAVSDLDTVKKITEFLAKDLDRVDALLAESLDDSESELVREVGQYVCFTKGKKLRPILTILTTQALAPEKSAPVEVAAAIELIHVATLLHDDVIDKASMRRGRPSVNARWGDDVAILMADYLYARAFDLALSTLRPEVMRLLCKVTQRMCEGEMFQIKLRDRNLTETDYLHVVERKTGSLFSACTALGALLGGASQNEINRARAFGFNFGIAFQITDDALDYNAHDEQWGKDIGMDVSGGKQTLPLLLALDAATSEDRAFIEKWMKNGRDFDSILDTINRYNGVERALDEARKYAELAAENLASLSCVRGEARTLLASLPEYVLRRAF